jgi:hypothetical protein
MISQVDSADLPSEASRYRDISDDELKWIIECLPDSRRLPVECIGCEVRRFGQKYRSDRTAEIARRPFSRLERDLNKGCLALHRATAALTNANKRSFSTWRKRAIEWIKRLPMDAKEALGVSGKGEEDDVLGPAYKALSRTDPTIGSQAHRIIQILEHTAAFVATVADHVPKKTRRSRAREELFNSLAQLYQHVCGHRPTYKYQVSSYYRFAFSVVSIFDPGEHAPGDVEHEHAVAEDILMAVRRRRGRRESGEFTILGSCRNRRDQKRAGAPT